MRVSPYLDGGLRSGFPILRAAQMAGLEADLSPVPILGLSTERADTAPSAPPRTGFDMAMYTIGQLVPQNHQLELSLTTLYERTRRERAQILFTTANQPGEDSQFCTAGFANPSPTFGNVHATFIPGDLGKRHLTIAGYQFDPLVMKGFFLAGRQMFLAQASSPQRDVLLFVRWAKTRAAVNATRGGTSWLADRRKEVAGLWAAWGKDFDDAEKNWNGHHAMT